MHCLCCGRVNRSDATFCDVCGTRLTASGGAPQAAVASADAQAQVRTPERLADGVFVGRQAELGVLQAALEDALAGRGRLVMLVGEPGIGKTRTAREFATHAQGRGSLVFWGRCHESVGAPPYWPWVQIIRAYVREQATEQIHLAMGPGATDIAEVVSEVRTRLQDLPRPPRLEDPEQARFRLFDAVTIFLHNAAHNHPLVLILDNLHWADKPSLLLLEFLAQELGVSRILVVGTYRDMELSRQHPLSETLGELTRERQLQRVLLRGLSREDVRRFTALMLGLTPPQALVEAVHTQTEGNPLFLTETVRLLMQEGVLAPEHAWHRQDLSLRLPEGVRDVIGKRLNRLSLPCNHLLTVAAVIGREFGLEEVARLMDEMSEERVLGLLEEAMAARVIEEVPPTVGRYQFTHALIQAMLYDELTLARRVQLHRRIGAVLEAMYDTNLEPHLARLAYHFGEAAPSGDTDKAIDYAAQAGARADALLAYEEATRYYDMALQVVERQRPGNEARRCLLLLAMGEAQRKGGDFVQAMATFERAAAIAKRLGLSEGLARAALGFEEASWRPGLPGNAAIQLCEEALRALGEVDSTLKARVLGSLARALAFTGAFAQAAVIGKQAIEMAQRLDDLPTLFATVRASLFIRHTRGGAEYIADRRAAAMELGQLAEQAGDRIMMMEAYTWHLSDLMGAGEVQAVDSCLTAFTQLAEEYRQPFYLYIIASFRAMHAVFTGRFAEAEQLAQQALAIGQRLRGQDATGVFGVQMFTLRREQGRLQEMAPAVRRFVQLSPVTSRWRPGLALIYSELGMEDEARAEFEQLAANDFAAIPQDALWVLCIVYLAEVCAFLGDARRAATLYQFLLPYAGYNIVMGPTVASYGAATRYLGLLAATMSRWSEAQQHFEDALTMNARMGAKPWLAHTQHAYAKMLLARGQAGDHEQAMSLLDAALAISHALDMHALAERATALQEHMRAQPHSSRDYPCGLTQREVEVLRLLAAGKSNREIADALFISSNTVANHVRSILTKTATANRTEATAYAIHHGLLEAE